MSKLRLIEQTGMRELSVEKGENLLRVLQKNGVLLSAVCGGRRSCGKCKVQVLSPDFPPSESDCCFLTQSELQDGIRLACTLTLEQDAEIRLPEATVKTEQYPKNSGWDAAQKVYAVADIGTTTVTAAIVDENGTILASETRHNAQAVFAADVISRVNAANAGQRELLTQAIQSQLNMMLCGLLGEKQPEAVTVCGNTVMLHLFLGASCKGLGAHPYTPVFLEAQTLTARDAGMDLNVPLRIPPCISVFTGADITAGILAQKLQADNAQGYTLLLDLGTNAELALFNNMHCYTSSAAAGPVFEGGSIRQGMAATDGAIYALRIKDGQMEYRTIGDAPACGICGTGILDIAAQLLQNGLVDSTGRLLQGECVILTPQVAVDAQDIRALQLAKAAIAAAADMLLRHAGIKAEQVERVVISGGLGNAVDPGSACAIGLIPQELRERTYPGGNSSLAGGVQYALHAQCRVLAEELARQAPYLDLSAHPDFMDAYIDHMQMQAWKDE